MNSLRILLLVFVAVILVAGVMFIVRDVEVLTLTPTARQSAPDGKYKVLSDGVTHFQEMGDTTAHPVLFVHGYSVPYYIWDGTFEAVADAGFHAIRYDMFGRGYSDRPNISYDPAMYVKQIDELLEAMDINEPIDIVCLSFGGPVTGHFVENHPEKVRKIVFIDPVGDYLRRPRTPKFIAKYLWTVFTTPGLAESQLADFYHPENFPDWAKKYGVQMNYKGFRNAVVSTRYDFTGLPINQYDEIGRLGKDALLIWGKEDVVTPFEGSERVQRSLKAELLAIDDAGHLPHLEHPEIVNPAIIEFLKEGLASLTDLTPIDSVAQDSLPVDN